MAIGPDGMAKAPVMVQQPVAHAQPAMAYATTATNTFTVTVPPGSNPGETFTVVSPAGKMVAVTVPQGAYKGQQLTVAY
jgi:hypothetical protein